MRYNIYCDESCHLEKDKSNIMVLGAMSCLIENKKEIFNDIRSIKEIHGLSKSFEIKWTKVSESKIEFYKDLVDYFFRNEKLSFRGLIAIGKNKLDNALYNNNDYDLWYYKMYFYLLDVIIYPGEEYCVFIDIKDTRGGPRVRKLQKVLCNNKYDYNNEVIKRISQINSKESEIMQIVDLIIGALSYYYRGLYDQPGNRGKQILIDAIKEKADITKTTPRSESKFNLFIWKPRGSY
ncbi:MAG: DUF3800 domain-containing protein [Bacillota bacterium]|jgi:hypothetical protein|nr:DUF3800 domain-containing protein [Bacillota bacterium]NLV63675.1 DUF3800 domain-containing protein [Clostridiaceae bacterium]